MVLLKFLITKACSIGRVSAHVSDIYRKPSQKQGLKFSANLLCSKQAQDEYAAAQNLNY